MEVLSYMEHQYHRENYVESHHNETSGIYLLSLFMLLLSLARKSIEPRHEKLLRTLL